MSKEKPERNIWNAQHIMLDIETLGGDAFTSPILAIAAMKFNPYAVTSKPFDEKYFEMDHIDEPREGIYYDTLNIHDQITHGRVMDLPTLEWWTNSPEKSSIINRMLKRQELLRENKLSFATQLMMFTNWIVGTTNQQYTYVWAYGNTFDMAFLETAYRMNYVPFPFHYQALMDVRTLVQTVEMRTMKNFPFVQDSRSHHALADVIKQIDYVKQAISLLA